MISCADVAFLLDFWTLGRSIVGSLIVKRRRREDVLAVIPSVYLLERYVIRFFQHPRPIVQAYVTPALLDLQGDQHGCR